MLRPLLIAALVACGGKDDPEPKDPTEAWAPDSWCPGSPGCAPDPSAPLKVGVAVRSVVPDCYESWEDLNGNAVYTPPGEVYFDCGCDQLCEGDPGYPGPDAGEGDGKFQAAWLAGFQNSRPASGVRDATVGIRGENDGLWARAVVLEQGNTSIGIVAIDAIGWMYDDVVRFRSDVAAAGIELDHLLVHSSHVHEGPDSMGLYGPSLSISGWSQDYADQTSAAVVEAVREAWDGRVEANMSYGQVDATDYWDNGVANIINDHRDPQIIDPRVGVAHFTDAAGDTITTMVHFSNHPETVADENTLMTSDFAHALRETVESGVTWDAYSRNGVGGTAVYINGSVGGMMTSLGANVHDPDGGERSSASFEKADIVGQLLGELALDAIENAQPVDNPQLAFRRSVFFVPVVNFGFQTMFELGVFNHRKVHNYDPDVIITEENQPDVQTEINLIDVGPIQMLSIPGELLPELAIGGYDGSFTPAGVDMIAPDNPNPPDLSKAPEGPYLHDRMSGEMKWIVGLGNDEIGYIVPPYNFILDDAAPWFFEADGDHYEETNSIGPDTAILIDEKTTELIDWQPPE